MICHYESHACLLPLSAVVTPAIMLQAWHNQLARGQNPAHTHRSLACHAPTATARRHLPARRVLARCQPPDNTLTADPPKETSSGSRPRDGPAATGSQTGPATGPASDSTKPTPAPLPPRTPYQPSGVPETTVSGIHTATTHAVHLWHALLVCGTVPANHAVSMPVTEDRIRSYPALESTC